jgi:hypothetical protein
MALTVLSPRSRTSRKSTPAWRKPASSAVVTTPLVHLPNRIYAPTPAEAALMLATAKPCLSRWLDRTQAKPNGPNADGM